MRVPAVALLLVLGACSPDSRTTASAESTAPAPAAKRSWALQARFPGSTLKNVAPVRTPAGVLEQHTEMFEDEDGAFFVQWADHPPDYVARVSREAVYDHAAEGAAAAVGGTITDSRRLERSGFVGREILVEDGRGTAYRSQFFLVEGRLHLAGVATSKERLSQPIVRDFFDSVRLVQGER